MGGRGSGGGGRKMAALTGSENQVSWATQIRSTVNGILDDAKKSISRDNRATNAQKKTAIKNLENYRIRVNSAKKG